MRFVVPYLISFALISGAAIAKLKNFKIVLIIIITITLFQYFLLSYFEVSHIILGKNQYTYKPRKEDWKIKEILEYIDKIKIKKPFIQVIADIPEFNDIIFPYISYKEGYKNKIFGPGITPLKMDYIITKTGDLGKVSWRYLNIKKTYSILINNLDKFILKTSFSLPDNSTALIYQRKD